MAEQTNTVPFTWLNQLLPYLQSEQTPLLNQLFPLPSVRTTTMAASRMKRFEAPARRNLQYVVYDTLPISRSSLLPSNDSHSLSMGWKESRGSSS